jgi:hypothetical protein
MRATETLVPELSERAQAEVQAVLEEARSRGADLSAEVVAVLDEARIRGGAAWNALRGETVGPPVAHRRWPVALAAAVAGAGAGVAVAIVLRRVFAPDAPGAQEPEDLQAVVDRGDLS